MDFKDFCYWLQGYFELKNKDDVISIDQINIIQQHLNLVLNKHPHMGIVDCVGPKYVANTGMVGPTGPTC